MSAIALLAGYPITPAQAGPQRPNVVLVFAEDLGPELSCYGHPAVKTPNLDRFAAEGVRFTSAFTTAPSCTPSRNAIATGVYQTRTDTQDQRRRGVDLPTGVRPFVQLLKEAGYYTVLGGGFPDKGKPQPPGSGYTDKTDYNFTDADGFVATDWSGRAEGQPFFAQVTLNVTHRQPPVGWGPVRKMSRHPVDPEEVALPPYLPDDPACRLDWAMYLDAIEAMDSQFGDVLTRLKRERIADNTVVVFIGDNGRDHMRGKCWLYEGGVHVPLIIRYQASERGGQVDKRLVSAIDVTATLLRLAGVDPPPVFDGRPLNDLSAPEREEVFAARDLLDEVRDTIRSVRTKRYKYLRNYQPGNGYRECRYVQDNRPMLPVIRRLAEQGKLNDAQRLLLADRKPREELYDLETDPYELVNLADSPEHASTLQDLRERLDGWIAQTGDRGLERLGVLVSAERRAATTGGADPDHYLDAVRSEMQKTWPKNRRIRLVFHGHSVPSGYFTGGMVQTFDAYPHLTHQAVSARYPTSPVSAITTGIGGEQSEQGAARFERDVLALQPDVVTIDYSLNDRAIGLKRAERAWRSMIEAALAEKVRVLLLTPSPDSSADLANPDDPLNLHASQVRRLAKEYHVGLVDSLEAFEQQVADGVPLPQLLSQPNHPNRAGHELITQRLVEWFD